ncbi:MAG: exodeoxyribonuclease VII large subunit [Actinomycetes bacterium]
MSDELDLGATTEAFGVRQFIGKVNHAMKNTFTPGIWVHGEIESWSNRTQHAYFQLVERDEKGTATIHVSLFANNLRRLQPLLRQHRLTLQDGVKVKVFGVPDVYDGSGKFSLKISDIDPRFTLGDLAAARDEIVKRLIAGGLYDENRERELPAAPLRLGIITSVGSAAWHDAMHELEESGIGFNIKVANVRVQGDEAIPMIVEAIWALGSRDDLDVILLMRGGGSRTDLACFDAEEIAVAIAQCGLPVFTGIGHEIDHSIADEVAYAAYKTPTACASAVCELVHEYVEETEDAWAGIAGIAQQQLALAESRLNERGNAIRTKAITAVERAHTHVALSVNRLITRPASLLATHESQVNYLAERVRLLDPVNTMARGWSITRTTAGVTLRKASDAVSGDDIVTTFSDGTVVSTVK